MKKKFLTLLLSFTVVMSMTACGGSDTDTGDASASVEEEESEPVIEIEEEDESAPEEEDADAAEDELVYYEVNGIAVALPANFISIDTGSDGMPTFASENGAAIVTVNGPLQDGSTTPGSLTEEKFTEMLEKGGYSDVMVTNVGTVEQPDGGTAVAAFATGSVDGDELNVITQYYFIADGSGAYILNYMYPVDDTATDDLIEEMLASVVLAE